MKYSKSLKVRWKSFIRIGKIIFFNFNETNYKESLINLLLYLLLYLRLTSILLSLCLVNLSITLSLKLMIFSAIITFSALNLSSTERRSCGTVMLQNDLIHCRIQEHLSPSNVVTMVVVINCGRVNTSVQITGYSAKHDLLPCIILQCVNDQRDAQFL